MNKCVRGLLTFSVGMSLVACNSNKSPAPVADVAKNQVAGAVKAEAKDAAADAKSEAAAPVKEEPAEKAKDNRLNDQSGNTYATLQINDLIWTSGNMQERSGVTCYANTGADADFIKKFGCLYTWDDAQKVCPQEQGWRLPTKEDYDKMMQPLGDSPRSRSKSLCASTFHGGSNESGFGALPAGMYLEGYNRFGQVAMFWTATTSEENKGEANYILVDPDFMGVGVYEAGKAAAYSVRCVKDVK